ncbi:TraG/TraD/VirD4 family protein [Clostridium estertheticum]|nr:TraG/TraD/VirD4 family protein [Clostridium estertheticum]
MPSPVYFLLEEFANIGRIPEMLEMLGTMRGLRVYQMAIL